MINLKSVSLERKIKSLIPNNAKKLILFFLTSPILGKIIKILKIKSNLFGGKFDYDLVSDIEAARIFGEFGSLQKLDSLKDLFKQIPSLN